MSSPSSSRSTSPTPEPVIQENPVQPPGTRTFTGLTDTEKAVPFIRGPDGRMVRDKRANKPFLKHQMWKADQERRAREAKERKERGEIDEGSGARGFFVAVLKHVFVAIIAALLLSRFVTDTWTWGYQGKWTNLKTYIPVPQRTFTPLELLQYDGSDPSKPLYIAIDGDVYDVSTGKRMYGPGASYSSFAGRDAARAYVTGCFSDHLTHDLRGLTEAELKPLEGWKSFFKNHKSYFRVGKVAHPPIDPASSPPGPCSNGGSKAGQGQQGGKPAGN